MAYWKNGLCARDDYFKEEKMDKKLTDSITFALCFSSLAGLFSLTAMQTAQAQEPFIYPEKGQSTEQQTKDKSACQTWATQQTGIDPVQLLEAQSSAQAAAPAATGGAAGGFRQRRQRKMEQAQAQQTQQAKSAQSDTAQKANTYERAYGACLKGKGYSIN
jgi:hypothetical protein